jgi:hypothetical protein
VQSTADLKLPPFAASERHEAQPGARRFVAALVVCCLAASLFASWLPLQVSIVTVFLFAGPHNWFELRYFLMRLPVRFGKSRNFFLTAFVGLVLLTSTYVSLPFYNAASWSSDGWLTIIAIWNSLLLLWLGSLIWLRGRQKPRADWSSVVPLILALGALNWFKPDLFSLAIVYIHPLIALWFLDRHLRRTRPEWLGAYRRCLCFLPLVLVIMIWQLSQTPPLADDNGLFWRITQHSGAELLPQVSSHVLVSVHLFLEMLHYGVWLLAVTLVGPLALTPSTSSTTKRENPFIRIWDLQSLPLVRHPKGFPKLVAGLLVVGLVLVCALWLGFSFDYATTRDIYFTVAIAHVLAEAPFLLRMI